MSTNQSQAQPQKRVIEGDVGFEAGQNSFLDPVKLTAGSYTYAVNMLNRGGVAQTRPGFSTSFVLPDGNLQGMDVFYPVSGKPQIIAVVSGNIYISDYPYNSMRPAPEAVSVTGTTLTTSGSILSPTAQFAYFCNATQSVKRNADTSLTVITPKNLIMIQDGLAPPVYWDGVNVVQLSGTYGTPQGTHMVWSGDRLWVALNNQLFAGDIGNPLSFFEQTYNQLGGMQSFFLPDNITGMAKVPSITAPTLLVFTASTTSSFRADIRTRTAWFTTNDFQLVILPTTGCLAHRSIVARAGQLYWFSANGMTSLDSSQFSLHSTQIFVLDQAQTRSKSNLSHDLSGIAAAAYENLMLTSVPEGGQANRHTWVHDAAPIASSLGSSPSTWAFGALSSPAWASIWTGVQPVQWATVDLDGRGPLFCASADLDGHNRVYQAFMANRLDNGVDIPWSLETRAVSGGTIQVKQLRDVELNLSEIMGQLDLQIQWAGPTRGRWKVCGNEVIQANPGSINASEVITSATQMFACKKQGRILRSNDVQELDSDPLTSSGVESPWKESLDRAFMFRISGSGQCAVRSIRIFMDLVPEPVPGEVSVDETGESNFVRFDGAASNEKSALEVPDPVFISTQTATASYGGATEQSTVVFSSLMSQSDADKRASQLAAGRANYKLRLNAPPYEGSKWSLVNGNWMQNA